MNDDLALLVDAAHASGKIARKHFNASPEIWEKDDGAGPVTEADLAIDAMLKSDLLAARPDYGWLSEESEDNTARQSCEHVFIIDPIDGTRAFIAGEKAWGHSLAIARHGIVVAAAVYIPMLDLMYTATDLHPSELNGDEIRPSSRSQLEGSTILTVRPNMKPENWRGSDLPIKRKFRPSLAYRLCLAAQGRYDAMITLRDCWEWDIAAGELIVRQAGGSVTDRHKTALKFNSQAAKTAGCIAGGPDIHRHLMERLTDPFPDGSVV